MHRSVALALVSLSLSIAGCGSAPASPAAPAAPVAGSPAAGAAAGSGKARWQAGPPRQIRQLEGITEYELSNGMRVLLFPDPSKETVTTNVTYLVGSRHEGYGETGMAHLLEHMLFKGSTNVPDLDSELERRGATYNASTWYDRTNYYETLPAKGDNLEWSLAMEADRMVNAFIRKQDLASEFSVVRNEMEAGENDPRAILEERILSTAYLWHNYGNSTIGARSDVEKVPAPALRGFYEKYYQPDNAVLVVAGKFEPKQALDLVNRTFGAIPRPARKLELDYTVEPVQDGERNVVLRRVGDVGIVAVAYHVVAGPDPDFAAVDAIGEILTAEPSGRLYKALVTTGMATGVSASTYVGRDPTALILFATVRADKPLDKVRDKMISIIEGLGNGTIRDDEVARFRARRKKASKHLFSNSQQLAMALSESVAQGDWRVMLLTRDRTAQVTPDQVKKVASAYLRSSNRTLGMFVPAKAPERAPLAVRPDVAAMLEGYTGAPPIAEGEEFAYTIDNIEKRTRRGKLDSGMTWAFLSKETRGDAVRARVTIRYGTEKDWKGKIAAASMLGDMMRRGTAKRSFQDITDQLDVLEATLTVSAEPGAVTFSVLTNRDNLHASLALIDEMLRRPTFPAAQLEVLRKEQLAALEEQKTDPQALAFTTMLRKVRPRKPTDIDYETLPEEQIARIKAVKVGQLKSLHALLGASHGQLTIVGDFDPAQTEAAVAKLWGGWKSARPYARLVRQHIDVQGVAHEVDTPDKENAFLAVGIPIAVRDDDPAYPALVVGNYVLGGGGFASRLVGRLREKEGWSYGAGSVVQGDPQDAVGILFCYAILAPQNAGKGLTALVEEFDRVVGAGLTDKDVAAARSSLLEDYSRNLSSDSFLLTRLHDYLYLGRTLKFDAERNARFKALTAREVNEALKARLDSKHLIKVTGLDKKKAAAQQGK